MGDQKVVGSRWKTLTEAAATSTQLIWRLLYAPAPIDIKYKMQCEKSWKRKNPKLYSIKVRKIRKEIQGVKKQSKIGKSKKKLKTSKQCEAVRSANGGEKQAKPWKKTKTRLASSFIGAGGHKLRNKRAEQNEVCLEKIFDRLAAIGGHWAAAAAAIHLSLGRVINQCFVSSCLLNGKLNQH